MVVLFQQNYGEASYRVNELTGNIPYTVYSVIVLTTKKMSVLANTYKCHCINVHVGYENSYKYDIQ